MASDIPVSGLHGRCVRIAVDGLRSLDESRELARTTAEVVRAAGGMVFDHAFLLDDADPALRLWAGCSEPVTFGAGLRAVLRCRLNRPMQPAAAERSPSPRVRVNVALAPPADSASPLILDLLGSDAEMWQLACAVVAAASGVEAGTDCTLSDAAQRLLATRPAGRHLRVHLAQVLGKLGLPGAAMARLLRDEQMLPVIPDFLRLY